MQTDFLQHALRNYRQLIERVDELCRHITEAYPAAVTCHRGCDSCCRHLTLFPVEGAALHSALFELPAAQATDLRQHAAAATADGPCPLLADGACRLYAARPLICRTHGLPLLLAEGEERRIDFCPRNFTQIRSLPATAVLDLERLNTALAGVNALFVREALGGAEFARRRSIAEFLRLSAQDFHLE